MTRLRRIRLRNTLSKGVQLLIIFHVSCITAIGTKDVVLKDGQVRKFLEDSDVVKLEAFCVDENGKIVINFGECTGKVFSSFSALFEMDVYTVNG